MVHLINYNNSIVKCYIIRRKLLSQEEMSLMSGRPIPLVCTRISVSSFFYRWKSQQVVNVLS